MRLREYLGYFSFFLRIKNNLFMRKKRVRILMYHDVYSEDFDKFERQIVFLKKMGYEFIDFDTFVQYLNGKVKLNSIGILLTFDDGFRSNYQLSKILDKYNIRGIFFIPPAYINSTDRETETRFIVHNLFLDNMNVSITDESGPLSWTQLQEMKRQGHTIGSHTNTHTRLSDVKDLKLAEEEFQISKTILERETKDSIAAFAYPFGDIDSITEDTLQMAATYYQYIFSAVRGFNNEKTVPTAIFRDQINPYDSQRYLQFVVEGGLDFLYRHNRALLQQYALKKQGGFS